jgi:hypothetical protein
MSQLSLSSLPASVARDRYDESKHFVCSLFLRRLNVGSAVSEFYDICTVPVIYIQCHAFPSQW